MAHVAVNDRDELDAMLVDLIERVQAVRDHQKTHGLRTTATGKLPGVLLHTLDRFRQRLRESPPHTDLH